MDSQSADQFGTFGTKHQWVGVAELVPILFGWIWFILAATDITVTNADYTYIPMIITGIWTFLGLVLLIVHVYYRNRSIDEARARNASSTELAQLKAAILNDKTLAVWTVIIGLTSFLLAMSIYIKFFNGETTFTASYHLDDVTLFLQTGSRRQLANQGMNLVIFGLATVNLLVFFLPLSHGSLISDVESGAPANLKKKQFDQVSPMGHWNAVRQPPTKV